MHKKPPVKFKNMQHKFFDYKWLPPPPLWKFYKNYQHHIWLHICRYEGQIVWNTCRWYPEKGAILRGRGSGWKAVWNFPENSSVLVPSSVPYIVMITDGVTKADEFPEHFKGGGGGGTQKQLLQSVTCFDFSQYNYWKNTPWILI